MQVVVDELLINYKKTGLAQPVVLCLHGWADRLETYDVLHLDTDKYSVIAIDLPGFGGSQAPSVGWGLDDYSVFLQHFIDKLSIDIHAVVGHSNGGAIAINAIARGVINTRCLVLLASSGVRPSRSVRNLALKSVTKPARLALRVLPASQQAKIKQKSYSKIGSDYMAAPAMAETFKKIIIQDVTEEAHKIQVPTLLMYGDKDIATPVHIGTLLHHAIEGSELHIVEGAGHFVHHDRSKDVETLVNSFIANNA